MVATRDSQVSVDNDPWLTFAQIFGPSYAILERLTSKPEVIGKTASAEQGGDKAAWIREMAPALTADFPAVRVVVWFERIKETDWRIDSSPTLLAAFRSLVTSLPFAR